MQDATAGLFWLLVNVLLAAAAWRASGRLFPADVLRQRAIHALLIGWATVVGAATALGALGVLTPAALLAGVAAVATGLFGWGTVAGGAKLPRRRPQLATARDAERWWAVAWGVLAALLAGRLAWDGLGSLPRDWDSLAYHLPLIDHWLREGTLYVPDCAFWYVPANNGLIGLWCVAPFSGDFLVALNNVPATVLLVAATVELAARLRLSPAWMHLTGMAVAATQPTVRQIVSAENDVAAAALFLASLVYSVRYLRRGRTADAAMGAVAAGLLAGVKYYALGYAAAAGTGLLLVLIVLGRWSDATRAAVWGAGGVMVWGAYWYARNFSATGTPLFPKGIGNSADVWSELRPDSHTSTLLQSGRAEVWPMLAEAVAGAAGPVHWAALLLLPAMLVWLGLSAWMLGRRSRFAGSLRWWLVCVLALALMVFIATPNIVETAPGALDMLRSKYHPVRLGLCFLSLAVVGLAVMLHDLTAQAHGKGRHAWRVAVAAAAAMAVVHQWILHLRPLVSVDLLLVALNAFLAAALLALLVAPLLRHGRCVAASLLVGLLLAGAWGCQMLGERWHRDYVAHYGGLFRTGVFTQAAALEPERERLAVCDYRYYPFLGSRRQFDVCRPLWLPDEAALLAYLDREQVTVLAVRFSDPQAKRWYAKFHGWISDYPDLFETIYEDSEYLLTRIRRERLAKAIAETRLEIIE